MLKKLGLALLLAGLLFSGIFASLEQHSGPGFGNVPAAGACPIVDPDCPD